MEKVEEKKGNKMIEKRVKYWQKMSKKPHKNWKKLRIN